MIVCRASRIVAKSEDGYIILGAGSIVNNDGVVVYSAPLNPQHRGKMGVLALVTGRCAGVGYQISDTFEYWYTGGES